MRPLLKVLCAKVSRLVSRACQFDRLSRLSVISTCSFSHSAGKMKRKRVSKNTKVAWRKHSKISDVEQFLDDQRLEERGGVKLSDLPDEQLFQVDKELSTKERKKRRLLEPPKCFSAINIDVKDTPLAKRIVKKRMLQAKRKKEKPALHRSSGEAENKNDLDIWIEDAKEKIDPKEWGWATNNTLKHHLGAKKLKTVLNKELPKKLKTSAIAAVAVPHPGMSYNPSYEDHQNLLSLVAEKESGIIKKEEHLNRVTRDMFCKVTPQKRDENWMKEMSLQEEEENEESDGDFKSINPPALNVKKTLQQRRKQKEQQKLELAKKTLKREKKKITDIHLLKVLNKKLSIKEKKEQMLREKREKVKKLKANDPKNLSSTKFQDNEMEFNMGMDIPGNLRNLKKEGSLLLDRYKSLQIRNIVEPSVKRHRKKAKVKKFVKPGHKNDWKETVAISLKI